MNVKNLKTWLSQYLNVKASLAYRPADSDEIIDNREKVKPLFSMVEILVRNPVQPT